MSLNKKQINLNAKTRQEALDFAGFQQICISQDAINHPYVLIFMDGSKGYYDLFEINGFWIFCKDE